MNNDIPKPVELKPTITFPHINVGVAIDGIKIEIFFGPTTIFTQMLDESISNAIFREWVKQRQKIKEQQQLIGDVMRSKAQGG